MNFDERYQLLEPAGDEGVKTFIAREVSTGKEVTAFLFVGEHSRLQAELLNRLRSADHLQLPELIEIGDNRGTVYVITDPRISFAELQDRASRLTSSMPPPPEHKTGEFSKAGIWRVPAALQAEELHEQKPASGSFTQMFQAAPPIGEAVSEPPMPPAPPPATSPVKPVSGSFTQMFQAAPPIGEAVSEPPMPPAPPPATSPVKPVSGSFTQMFQAAPPIGEAVPEPPMPPAPPPVAPQSVSESIPKTSKVLVPPLKQPEPGEFTRIFQAAAPPIGEAKQEISKASAPQPSPGSFTQMFQATAPPIGESRIQAPKAPPAQPAPGEFTRFFSTPTPPPTAPPLPAKPEAQGDFDRVFGQGDRVINPGSSVTGIFNQSAVAQGLKPPPTGSASAPAPPAAFSPAAGEFTRIFGETSMHIPTLDPLPAQQAPKPHPPAGSPGEYTRMFGASSIPADPISPLPPAPATVQAAASPSADKKTSKLVPVLIGVIALLLVAIAIILVVAK